MSNLDYYVKRSLDAESKLYTMRLGREVERLQNKIVKQKVVIDQLRAQLDRRSIRGWAEFEGLGLRPHSGRMRDGAPVVSWYLGRLTFDAEVHDNRVLVGIEEIDVEFRSVTYHRFEFRTVADAAFAIKEQMKEGCR